MKNEVSNSMGDVKKKRSKTTRKNKPYVLHKGVKNVIMNISFKDSFKVEFGEDEFSKEDKTKINSIIKHMQKNIWIDRTYVEFKGNRFKDAFITEKGWNEFIDLISDTDFGNKTSKYDDDITSCLLAMSIAYLYNILKHYEYDVENIMIYAKKKSKFVVEYMKDDRTSWNF